MKKSGLRKWFIAFFSVLLLSILYVGVVYAREDKAQIDVYRIDKTFVILKITFPTDISGNFAGTLAGKHFDCITIPPNVVLCIGRFRAGSDPSFLTLYDQDTKENVLVQLVTSPPWGDPSGDETPAPSATGTPPPDDGPSIPEIPDMGK